MPQEGMLLQLDGSHHRWLQHRGPHLVLLLAIDDATGTAPYALFREREDTVGYLNLLKTVMRARWTKPTRWSGSSSPASTHASVFLRQRPSAAIARWSPVWTSKAFSFKQHRIVGRDNTVSYRGRSPQPDRASFAGSFVEVQERLDGTPVIHSRREAVPSQDAPPRAAALRKRQDVPLSGWWKDEQAEAAHRERVLAGMQHAWKQGNRIGRPPVIERPGFPQRRQRSPTTPGGVRSGDRSPQ
jgi:hypothetical protein